MCAQVSWYMRPDRLVVSFMYVASTQSPQKSTFQVPPTSSNLPACPVLSPEISIIWASETVAIHGRQRTGDSGEHDIIVLAAKAPIVFAKLDPQRRGRSTTVLSHSGLLQAEIFTRSGHYQPVGTVRMTWLDVGAQRGVVGISLGTPATPSAIDFQNLVILQKSSSRQHTIHTSSRANMLWVPL